MQLDLRVMTFNVRFPSASDHGNLWPDRRDILAGALREFAPDVIGMQETYRTQLADILADTPGYTCVGRERRGGTDEEHNPILVRADRYMIEEAGTFWYSDTPSAPGSRHWMPEDHPRVVTWARVLHLPTETRLMLMNTHLPLGDDGLRARCARLLADRVGGSGLPTIVTGDFNSVPDSAPHDVLTSSGLTDSWSIARHREGPESTFHRFSGAPSNPGHRIDWILVSPGIDVERMMAVDYQVGGKYPSDHFPVVADLEVKCADEEDR